MAKKKIKAPKTRNLNVLLQHQGLINLSTRSESNVKKKYSRKVKFKKGGYYD